MVERNLETELKEQTDKWLERLKLKISEIKIVKDSEGLRNSIENIQAYLKDAEYFLQMNDVIRAFEAVVYAWGILETCERLGLLRTLK